MNLRVNVSSKDLTFFLFLIRLIGISEVNKPCRVVSCRVSAGNRGQHLRGGVGHHQTRHVLWDQRVASSTTPAHL